MIIGTSAIGALCRQSQFAHWTQYQQRDQRNCSRSAVSAWFASAA
jgi:hypothetical protein